MLPPGVREAGLLQLDAAALDEIKPPEFWARVYASHCEVAGQFSDHGNSLFVNYEQLPAIVWESWVNFFGMPGSPDDMDHMRGAARLNAKSPTRVFECDSERKRQAATDAIRAIVDRVAMPYHRQLQLIPNTRRGVEKCSTI